ncbi:MAG: CDP-alcohol phosphatidyltransferase family protein [Parachlamydiaceae bacterium]
MIFTFSNFLSLLRGPLAFLFLLDDPFYRGLAIVLAMATDNLDGYLARKYRTNSQFGAFLDPLMDKFFVFFAVAVFIKEENIQIWQAFALISRDFAVLIFGLYLALRKTWTNFQFRSIWSGKITTTLQFFVLLGLTFHIAIPIYIFWCFVVLGVLALVELYFIERQMLRRID